MTHIMHRWLTALLGVGVGLSLVVTGQSQPLRSRVVVGTGTGDGALHGVLTITGLELQETGQLVVTGTLGGTVGSQVIQETWTTVAAQFRHGEGPGVCAQLLLDLAPAYLEGVGLTVAVAPMTFDLTALRGSEALLGQQLCALTYLLENPSLHARGMQNLLNAINPRLAPGDVANESSDGRAP